MKKLSIKDVRANLSQLVGVAARGETVVITRRGKEAAQICALPRHAKALPSLSGFRARIVCPETGLSLAAIQDRREERY